MISTYFFIRISPVFVEDFVRREAILNSHKTTIKAGYVREASCKTHSPT
jgi:hypothetical protein